MSIRRTTRAGIPRHYHESSHFLNTPLPTHKNQTTQKMRGIEISAPPPQQKLSYHLRHLNRNLKTGVPPKRAVLFRCVQRNCNTNRAITKSARGLIFLIFSFDLEMTIYVSRGSIYIKQNDQHTTIKQIRGHLANHSHTI